MEVVVYPHYCRELDAASRDRLLHYMAARTKAFLDVMTAIVMQNEEFCCEHHARAKVAEYTAKAVVCDWTQTAGLSDETNVAMQQRLVEEMSRLLEINQPIPGVVSGVADCC